jgi:hypothetical protein
MSLIEDLITPEMNKLEKVRGHSQHLYEFLTWMKKNNKEIGDEVEDLVLEYYDINKVKIETERRMLRESLEREVKAALKQQAEEEKSEGCTTSSEPENS